LNDDMIQIGITPLDTAVTVGTGSQAVIKTTIDNTSRGQGTAKIVVAATSRAPGLETAGYSCRFQHHGNGNLRV